MPVRRLTVEQTEKRRLDAFCQRAAAAIADGDVVDLAYRRHLDRRAREKCLVCAVELLA